MTDSTTHKTRETLRALGVLPAVDFFVKMSECVIGITMSIEPVDDVEFSMDWRPLTKSDDDKIEWTWS